MLCPDHNTELEPVTDAPVAGGIVLVCPIRGCSYSRMPPLKRTASAVQPKLPLDPGRQQSRVKVRERDLQQAIVDALQLKGYEVLITSRVRKRVRCEGCGQWGWMQGGDGVSKGTPDLFVWVALIGAWRGLEVKGSETAVRPEQQRLAGEGKIALVRSVEEAMRAVSTDVY